MIDPLRVTATSPHTLAKKKRRDEIAAIHASASALGMDTADKSPDSEYRTILRTQGGQSSAADLDEAGRQRVLRYLLKQRNLGGHAALIEKLWLQLGSAGALHDPSPGGLRAFLQKGYDVASPRWLNTSQSNKVVEALKAWLKRHKASK